MSLDVYLEMKGLTLHIKDRIFIREDGSIKEITRKEWDRRFPGREPIVMPAGIYDRVVYQANITHNLIGMAKKAGIYMHLWRPEEIDITKAQQLIDPLAKGLSVLLGDPSRFKKLNPLNGWGTYEGLVEFVDNYLRACHQYPEATVSVSR